MKRDQNVPVKEIVRTTIMVSTRAEEISIENAMKILEEAKTAYPQGKVDLMIYSKEKKLIEV